MTPPLSRRSSSRSSSARTRRSCGAGSGRRSRTPSNGIVTRYVAAVIQHPPVFLNRDATVARACALIAEAAREGASVIAFPESFIPGYPMWVYDGAVTWDDPVSKRLYAQFAANSLEVGGAALETLASAAREHHVSVVMGATERDAHFSRGSLYNSLFFIGDTGELLGVHRKLMPTYAERLVWTPGDASGIKSYDTDHGRIGGLMCWEHWMPVTRFAMHTTGEHVHVAAWPDVPEMDQVASRHYAFEGRCYVLAAAQSLSVLDVPNRSDLPPAALRRGDIDDDSEMLLRGGSGIIAPDGTWIAGPAGEEPTIVYGEIDLTRVLEEQLALDTAGHYHRPDIFSVSMNVDRREPIVRVVDASALLSADVARRAADTRLREG